MGLTGRVERQICKWKPEWSYDGDRLFVSSRRLLQRVAVGLVALVLVAVALLLTGAEWRGVLAGALLAWGVSMIAWSFSTYSKGRQDILVDLRRNAEMDLLHARLNLISKHFGLPVVDLDAEWEHAIHARMARLAHFAGLDEFRVDLHSGPDDEFWTSDAMGRKS